MEQDIIIRKAHQGDIDAIAEIYRLIHAEETAGRVTIGWLADDYPMRETAEMALEAGTLFAVESEGRVVASFVINHEPLDAYSDVEWLYPAAPHEIGVLHTMVVHPEMGHRGIGRRMVAYFEDYSRSIGCKVARLDTQPKNTRPFGFYPKIGYRVAGIVPTVFRGTAMDLAMFEKLL